MKRVNWEPGNCTRYDLIYVNENGCVLLAWLRYGGSGGTCIRFDDGGPPIHYSYLMEKMNLSSSEDADAILEFLESEGHKVMYHDERHRRTSVKHFMKEVV